MSLNSKIIISIIILAAVFLAAKFFNLGPFRPGNSGASFPKEVGRAYQNFTGTPPVFPDSMPVERDPAQMVKSYAEFIDGDATEGELRHTQYTYAYVSAKTGQKIISELEKYFKDNGFSTVKASSDDKLSFGLSGRKGEEIIVNLSVAPQNQFERLVTASLIFLEKIPVTE